MNLREFLERYGITLVVLGALAIVAAAMPSNVTSTTASRLTGGGGSGAEAGGPAAGVQGGTEGTFAGGTGNTTTTTTGRLAGPGGVTGRAGGAAAATGSVLLGQGPCRPDSRMKGVSRYTPPCLKWVGGDNGGATYRGVTKDTIKVVAWISARDPGTEAILEGAKLADPPTILARAYDALRIYYNQHYETYGREVQVVEYHSSYNSSSPSDEILKQDAAKIEKDVKPFAVIVGDPAAQIPKVLGQELANRGIVCMCTVGLSSQFYKENPPYIFSSLPTADEYAAHIGEYICKRLGTKPAKWAGDPTIAAKARKYFLVYLQGAYGQVDPEGRRARDLIVRELGKCGIQLPEDQQYAYLYDPGRNQQDVSGMIIRMRQANATTIIPVVDPLYPILITSEATRQQFYPEWLVTGTGLMDTTAAGRLYDQAQWRHAFGISPLWVTWATVANSPGYREFYHGLPDAPRGSCGADGKPGQGYRCEGVLINIYRAYFQTLLQGIHLAGPKLTADTFAAGILAYPRTGGTAAAPTVFRTREFPTEIKDFTEVFYAADQSGPDERGEQGLGMIEKVEGGRRYATGQWPSTEPRVFDMTGAVAVSDNPQGGGDPPHEQDGHRHSGKCLSCSS
jgi:hypothetical protein